MSNQMKWAWCAECDAYHQEGYHKTLWRVWCVDEPIDEALQIRADEPGHAAERWAEQCDRESGDYTIANGWFVTACVLPAGPQQQGEPLRYRVSGEYEPQYSAAKEETQAQCGDDAAEERS